MITCAGCQQPLRRGEKFSLHGTEVFHRGCSTRRSVSERLRERVRELEADAVRLKSQVIEAVRKTNEAAAENVDLRRRRDQLEREAARQNDREAENIRLRLEITTAKHTIQMLKSDNTMLDREVDDALNARDAARAERDSARAEAALHQTIGGVGHGPVVVGEVVQAPVDERDDTEVRFSLLEPRDERKP